MDPQRPGEGRGRGRGGGRGGACPACHFRRQSCKPDCIFALHFPDPAVCADVLKIFGYARTAKLLQQVEPEFQGDLVKSMSWEARMWRRSPVPGCLAYKNLLEEQITQKWKELAVVRAMLEDLRGQQHVLPNNNNSLPHAAGGNDHHNMHASSSTSVEEDQNMQHLN